jgi:hypothetical protein
MVTRQGHHPPLKDTTVCNIQEDTTRITIREEIMHEMTGGLVGLPRGLNRRRGLRTCPSRISIGAWSLLPFQSEVLGGLFTVKLEALNPDAFQDPGQVRLEPCFDFSFSSLFVSPPILLSNVTPCSTSIYLLFHTCLRAQNVIDSQCLVSYQLPIASYMPHPNTTYDSLKLKLHHGIHVLTA